LMSKLRDVRKELPYCFYRVYYILPSSRAGQDGALGNLHSFRNTI
jgi:hypothetical protein